MTRAAQELGVTHSAISQQVRQLEEHMGRRLFDRIGRRVEPTEAGRALLQDVTAAFDQIGRACEHLNHRGVRRVLTLSAPACLALRWLIPKMARFQLLHPGLELQIETMSPALSMRPHHTYAALISRQKLIFTDYECRPLLEHCSTVVLAPRLAEKYRLTRPEELAQLTPLHIRVAPDQWSRWFGQFGQSARPAPDGPVFDDLALALEAASAGLGAVISPLPIAAKDLAEGRLVAPFPALALSGPGYYLIYRREEALQRGPRELLRWLDEESCAKAATAPSMAIETASGRLSASMGRRE